MDVSYQALKIISLLVGVSALLYVGHQTMINYNEGLKRHQEEIVKLATNIHMMNRTFGRRRSVF